jgi:hypothetical protein
VLEGHEAGLRASQLAHVWLEDSSRVRGRRSGWPSATAAHRRSTATSITTRASPTQGVRAARPARVIVALPRTVSPSYRTAACPAATPRAGSLRLILRVSPSSPESVAVQPGARRVGVPVGAQLHQAVDRPPRRAAAAPDRPLRLDLIRTERLRRFGDSARWTPEGRTRPMPIAYAVNRDPRLSWGGLPAPGPRPQLSPARCMSPNEPSNTASAQRLIPDLVQTAQRRNSIRCQRWACP